MIFFLDTISRWHFADDIFKCIFLNENAWISLKISLMFIPKVRNNYVAALVQIMAWRRPGDKPLSEPMMVSLLTHICVKYELNLYRHECIRQSWWSKIIIHISLILRAVAHYLILLQQWCLSICVYFQQPSPMLLWNNFKISHGSTEFMAFFDKQGDEIFSFV